LDQGQDLLKEDVHGHLREEDLEDAADFHQDALLFVVVLVVDHAVHRQDVVEVHPGEQLELTEEVRHLNLDPLPEEEGIHQRHQDHLRHLTNKMMIVIEI